MRTIGAILGGIWGVGLLVVALWAWRRQEAVATYFAPHILAVVSWAVRCGAVALAAAGEGILATCVVGNVRPARVGRRDAFAGVVGLSAALVFMLSAASAVALGLAGR